MLGDTLIAAARTLAEVGAVFWLPPPATLAIVAGVPLALWGRRAVAGFLAGRVRARFPEETTR